jgi:hypothetical protein
MKKILLVCLAFCLLTSNIEAKIWNPFGKVVTYNKGGHAWDNIIITQETRTEPTYKTWITVTDYRFNELGCLETVFKLYQQTKTGSDVKVEFIREAVIDVNCDF